MPLGSGIFGENTVKVLRHTGCNGVIFRREFIDKEDFPDSMGYLIAINHLLKEASIAGVKVNAPYFTGVG